MAEVVRGIKLYARNEKRPWSEFRLNIFLFLVGFHVLAIAAIVWHAVGGFWPSSTVIWTGVTLYVLTIGGVALGYHRLFTHNGYECGPVLKGVLLLCGGLAAQGDTDTWVRTHWYHHSHSDKPGDPHSPFQYSGSFWRRTKGVLWAHMGWLFYHYHVPKPKGTDRLSKDRLIQFQSRHYAYLVVATFVLPALICGTVGLVDGGWTEMWVQALDGFLIAGALRVVVSLHITWFTNSVCHLVGKRFAISVTSRTATGEIDSKVHYPSDGSRNAYGLKLLSFGEANHAFHHLFQKVAYHGWFWWSIDPSKWILIVLERLGLVWGVEKPPEFEVVPLEVRAPEDSFLNEDKSAGELVTV